MAGPVIHAPARWFHGITLAFGALVLVVVGRGQWFFGDEWDPILLRSVSGDAPKGLLSPHNEHWSTVPVLVYRAHLAVFGLRTYLPLMVMFIAVGVLTAHLLWRVSVRAGADPFVAAVLALLVLCFAPAGEDAVYAWNATFVGAVACGLGILLLTRASGPFTMRDAWAAWGLGLLALMLSGVALTMLVVVFVATLVARGWRVALTLVSVPAAVYVGWTIGWGSRRASLLETGGIGTVPRTVTTGITHAFDDLTRGRYVGILVVIALVVYVGCTWRSWRYPRIWALACAVGAVFFYAVVAIRRDSEFLPGPETGRYLWIAFMLLVPLLALAISAAVRRHRAVAVLAAAGAVVLVVVQLPRLRDAGDTARAEKQSQRREILAGVELVRSGASHVGRVLLPTSAFEHATTVERLVALADDGKLGHTGLRAKDRLNARASLQVAFDSARDTPSDPPAAIVGVHGALAAETGTGCVLVTPTDGDGRVVFQPGSATTAATIENTSLFGPQVVVRRGTARSAPRGLLPLWSGPSRLRLAPSDATVELAVGATPTTLCNVTVDPSVLRG